MGDNQLKQRIDFVLLLLEDWSKHSSQIKMQLSQMEEGSAGFFDNIYANYRCEVESDVNGYKENIKKINLMNQELTAAMNEWYKWSKDEVAYGKLSYPLQRVLKKKSLQKKVVETNTSIQSIMVQNRFILEKLQDWEHNIKKRAVQEISKEAQRSEYGEILKRKTSITEALLYLLPTIPGLCPVVLHPDNLDNLKKKLNDIKSA